MTNASANRWPASAMLWVAHIEETDEPLTAL
jgi:hypothetical protein